MSRSNHVAVVVYKHILRRIRHLAKSNDGRSILIQRPISGLDYGQHTKLKTNLWNGFAREALPPLLEEVRPKDPVLTPKEFLEMAKKAAAYARTLPEHKFEWMLDEAFLTLRFVGALADLQARTSVQVTKGIRVACTTQYNPALHGHIGDHISYFYHVRFDNQGDQPVKLMGRALKWYNTETQVIISVPRDLGTIAPKVVGQAPVLQPGEAFEYVSGVSEEGRGGLGDMVMEGRFRFVTKYNGMDGSEFDALLSPVRCINLRRQMLKKPTS